MSQAGDIEVKIGGRTYAGRWNLSRGMLHVNCAQGSRSVPAEALDGEPDAAAVSILRDLVATEQAA